MFTSIHTLKDLHVLIIVQGVPVQALLMSFSLFKRSAIKKNCFPVGSIMYEQIHI